MHGSRKHEEGGRIKVNVTNDLKKWFPNDNMDGMNIEKEKINYGGRPCECRDNSKDTQIWRQCLDNHTREGWVWIDFRVIPTKNKVSEKEVLPVEIHSVQKSSGDKEEWLTDRHVQEIIQLLNGAVTSYIETRGGKQTTNKQQQKPSDIVTGTSVRFGYMFRPRPGSQTCLVEENVYKDQPYDRSLRNFHVLKDKLVVFAHPLIPGSPRMSQLMKVLKVKRQSTGQSVSISSYFQKVPSQNALFQTVSQTLSCPQSDSQDSSGSQTATTLGSCLSQPDSHSQTSDEGASKDNHSVSSMQEAPRSEGKRKKIKNILERGEIGRTRRLQRKRKVNHSEKLQDEKDEQEDEADEIVGDDQVTVENVNAKELTENNSDQQSKTFKAQKMKEGSSFHTVKVTACASPCVSGISKESYIIGNVHVSKVESPCVNIDRDKSEKGDTVTLISVEQMNEIQRDKRTIQSNAFESLTITSDSAEDMSGNQVDALEDRHGNQSEPQSDSSNEMLELPSTSICTRETKRISSAINMKQLKTHLKQYEADVDTDSVTDSPTFKTRKSGKEVLHEEIESEECDELLKSSLSERIESNRMKKLYACHKENKISHTQRFKRKFPSFSDSDSDNSVPEKRVKTKSSGQNFVTSETIKNNSKKLQISKSFFTGDGGKVQPTLSFFVSNKSSSQKKAGDKSKFEALREAVDDDNDIGDIDCMLMKELSDFPKVKNEADVSLRNEIRVMNSISKLNEDHLQYLIRVNEKYLREIFEGKVSCDRHQAYKKGGNSRRNLNYKSCLSQYTEEQVDIVMESLMSIFCKRHHKYLDYIMKVLLPEMLIKLYMDVHGTAYRESEKTLAPGQLAMP